MVLNLINTLKVVWNLKCNDLKKSKYCMLIIHLEYSTSETILLLIVFVFIIILISHSNFWYFFSSIFFSIGSTKKHSGKSFQAKILAIKLSTS